MRKFLLLVFVAFTLTEAQANGIKSGDEDQLKGLLDSFAVAMVKKDKSWLVSNLTESCKMYEPSGSTLDRQAIVYTFTEGVYTVSKSKALNKSFKIISEAADGSADFEIEGVGIVNGNQMDIAGLYVFNMKFQKLEGVWKISEITINGN